MVLPIVPMYMIMVLNEIGMIIRTERYENSFFPYNIKTQKILDEVAKSLKSTPMSLFNLLGTSYLE